MTGIRLRAIYDAPNSPIESDTLSLSQRDLFGTLAGQLGIETITLLNRMRDYRCETLDIAPGFLIRATFTHTRYRFNGRRDTIATDKVSLVWEWVEADSKWVQLGVTREPIETREHYHSEGSFNAATAEARAESLLAKLA